MPGAANGARGPNLGPDWMPDGLKGPNGSATHRAEARESGAVGRFLIRLSGADQQILAECSTEKPKYISLGLTVLVPGLMAAVSMAFALVNVLGTELGVALLFAAAWAAVIVSLDRTFVVSLPRKGTWQAQIFRAVPRFLLALILGLVISTPFVLRIFRPEIAHQIELLHAADQATYFKNLPHNPVYLTVQRDKDTVSSLTIETATGGPGINPSTDPTIEGWQNQLRTAQNNEQTWFADLQCQLYGTALPGGSKCIQGNGPLAHDDQAQWVYWKGQVATVQGEIQQRTTLLRSQSTAQQAANRRQAQSQLTAAKQALNSAEQQLTLQTAGITSGINNDHGLLTQLQALGNATSADSTLGWARFLLFLLFIVIDLMPVVLKIVFNLGPENNYDKLLEAEEARQLQAADARRAARSSVEKAELAAWVQARHEQLHGRETKQRPRKIGQKTRLYRPTSPR